MEKLIQISIYGALILLIYSCKKITSDNNSLITKKTGNLILISPSSQRGENVYLHILDSASGGVLFTQTSGDISYTNNGKTITPVIGPTNPVYDIQAHLTSADGSTNVPFSAITIGKQKIPYNSFQFYGNLLEIRSNVQGKGILNFGSFYNQSQTIAMYDTTGTQVYSANVYAPLALNVISAPTYDKNGKLYANNSDGITLTWNQDPNNVNGVAIVLQDVENYETSDPVTVFTLPDNGSYTITQQYLAPYVQNKPNSQKFANISVNIYRGDNQMVTGIDGRTYQSVIYSMVGFTYQLY